MRSKNVNLKPQDIVILFKLLTVKNENRQQVALAESLKMSQSEISQSLARSDYAGLISAKEKRVMRLALLEFLEHGISYAFPQKPGALVRGVPTAFSAAPLSAMIESNEHYVWPYAKGTVRGQSILPLYQTVPQAALIDGKLYELLALTDALRVGRAREKALAISELKKRILKPRRYIVY